MNEAGSQPKKRSWLKIGCLGIVGFIVAMLALGVLLQAIDPEGTARRAAEAEAAQAAADKAEAEEVQAERLAAIDSALAVTSRELSAAYESNEVAAQQQFGDRPLLVSGTITAISLDFMDEPVISLNSVNEFLSVQASLDDKEAAGRLSKGQEIKLLCQTVTEVIGAPQLSECELVK